MCHLFYYFSLIINHLYTLSLSHTHSLTHTHSLAHSLSPSPVDIKIKQLKSDVKLPSLSPRKSSSTHAQTPRDGDKTVKLYNTTATTTTTATTATTTTTTTTTTANAKTTTNEERSEENLNKKRLIDEAGSEGIVKVIEEMKINSNDEEILWRGCVCIKSLTYNKSENSTTSLNNTNTSSSASAAVEVITAGKWLKFSMSVCIILIIISLCCFILSFSLFFFISMCLYV